MKRENKYFDESFMELVVTMNGKPVQYCSVARRTRADETTLRARIEALTGFRVTFGEWRQFEPVGKDFESSSEIDLFVEED
jgi:hypothetical protein